tara:strand:+ start:2761 stop:3531 length:771 start_codon:yes stop_codon:yes gene_type:complete
MPPSPIKEPHDFRSASFLKKIIPPDAVVNTALFFSGQLEFALSAAGRTVKASTTKYVVYEFWKCAMRDPHRIIKIAEFMYARKDPNMLYYLQEDWPTYKDPFMRSCMFFLLNRFSSTGEQSRGVLSYDNYNPIVLSRLKNLNYTNFTLNLTESDNLTKSLCELPNDEYVLIPVGRFSYNLFEHGKTEGWETTKVDHSQIKEFLHNTDKKTLLVYKWHNALASFFEDFNITRLNEYGLPTQDPLQTKEVIIANFRID